MSKTKLFVIFVGVAILILAIPLVLFLTIDINSYKSQISDAVEKSTGRKLEIAGRLQRSLFPKLGITISDTRLSNPPGFSNKAVDDKPFVELAKLNIYIQVMPLFSKKLVVNTVVLEGLKANLHQTADGKNNWTFSTGEEPTSSKQTMSPATDQAEPASTADSLAALSVAGLEIVDAQLSWRDQQSNSSAQLDKLNLHMSAITQNQPISLALSSHVRYQQPGVDIGIDKGVDKGIDADIALKSVLNADVAQQRYQATIKDLTVKARGDIIPNKQQTVNLSAKMDFDGNTKRIDISQLTFKTGELNLTGKLKQTGTSPVQFQGQIKIDPFNLRKQLQLLAINLPADMPGEALNQLGLLAEFEVDTERAKIPKLQIQLDDSKLNANIEKFEFANLSAKWQLQLDQIDLGRYLPDSKPASSEESSAKQSTPPVAESSDTQVMLPISLLQSLNQDGQIKIGKLVIQNIPVKDIHIGIKAKQGNITIDPLKSALYDGTIDGKLSINVQSKNPKITIKQKISTLLVGKLLTDSIQYDNISDTTIANAEMDVQTTGNNIEAWTNNLGGTAQFQLTGGAINEVNISRKFQDIYQKIKREPLDTSKFNNQTVFDKIAGSVTIDQGIVRNKDLIATSKELDATGSGMVNLPKQTVDYVARVSIENLPPGWARDHFSALLGEKIPVKIKGAFSKLDINYQDGVVSMIGKVATKAVKRKAEEAKQKLKQEVKESADKKIDAEKARLKEKAEKEKERLKERLKKLF